MLQVSPVTTHRIAMNGANMVVSSHHRTGETFQNDAESSRCDVKGAGLEPDTIRVGNPETVIFQVDVGNEVFAAPSIRLEAISETAKGGDRHKAMIGGQTSDVRCQMSGKLTSIMLLFLGRRHRKVGIPDIGSDLPCP